MGAILVTLAPSHAKHCSRPSIDLKPPIVSTMHVKQDAAAAEGMWGSKPMEQQGYFS